MQLAHVMVALGGDINNTVPRYEVTAAEIAVLRAIHGGDAVFDVQPAGEIKVRNRDELARLKFIYGHAKDSEGKPHIENLYPGAAARVFETLDELDLSPAQYVATSRASADEVADFDDMEPEEAPEPAAEEELLSAAEIAKQEKAAKAAAKAATKKKEELF